ncbi:Pregnancy-specific beta-1-glycoprotein 9, partial [Ophiophagus hannah]
YLLSSCLHQVEAPPNTTIETITPRVPSRPPPRPTTPPPPPRPPPPSRRPLTTKLGAPLDSTNIALDPEKPKIGGHVTLIPTGDTNTLSACSWFRGGDDETKPIVTYSLPPLSKLAFKDGATGREFLNSDCSLHIKNLTTQDEGFYKGVMEKNTGKRVGKYFSTCPGRQHGSGSTSSSSNPGTDTSINTRSKLPSVRHNVEVTYSEGREVEAEVEQEAPPGEDDHLLKPPGFQLGAAAQNVTIEVRVDPDDPDIGWDVSLTPSGVKSNLMACHWYRGETNNFFEILAYEPKKNSVIYGPASRQRETIRPDCALLIRSVLVTDSDFYAVYKKSANRSEDRKPDYKSTEIKYSKHSTRVSTKDKYKKFLFQALNDHSWSSRCLAHLKTPTGLRCSVAHGAVPNHT